MFGTKEHASVGAMMIWVTCTATSDHDVQGQSADMGHVWVSGFTATRVCVDINGSYYH